MKFVYVVTMPGFAKVGFTTDWVERLRSYCCTNPAVTAFEFILRVDSRKIEKRAQRVLAARFEQVSRTEWFRGATCVDCLDALAQAIRSTALEKQEREAAHDAARAERARGLDYRRLTPVQPCDGRLIRDAGGRYFARYPHPFEKDAGGAPLFVQVALGTKSKSIAGARLSRVCAGKTLISKTYRAPVTSRPPRARLGP